MAENPSGHGRRPDEPHCYNCGGIGHWAMACPEPTRQTPAGLEAWRSSSSTPSHVSRNRENRSSSKKSKGPIITKYAPPAPAAPAPGSFPHGPGYHPPPMSGPYPGPPIPSYSQHHHNAPPEYPPYSPPHPSSDPRYQFRGHPSQSPQPPPPTYGPPAPYGLPPGPPGYGGHAGHLQPPPPPQTLSLPPPPHTAGPPYPSPYGPYPPHHGPGSGQGPHEYRPQGPPVSAPPPVHYAPPPHRKQPPPRPPPRSNSSSKLAHSPGTKSHLPAPPITHSLPPKPPPSAHDRIANRPDRHRDNRSKKKQDKHDRHKGPRDNRRQDAAPFKTPPNGKHNPERREQQGHHKHATKETKPVEKLLPPEIDQPNTAQEESARDRDSGGGGDERPAHSDVHRNEKTPSITANEAGNQDPEDDEASRHLEEVRGDQIPRSHGEDIGPHHQQLKGQLSLAPAAEIHRRESVPSPASGDRALEHDMKLLADEPPNQPKLGFANQSPTYNDAAKDEAVVLHDGSERRKRSFARQSSQGSPVKRRRSNDDNHYVPESPQRRRVTESNLNSLQRSYRSPQGRHTAGASKPNRRRSASRDRSRQSSPGPSISSRSSGLDSLEAELLGRPAKGRSEDAVEHHEKLSPRSPKAKRRRPNVDSAYSRRW